MHAEKGTLYRYMVWFFVTAFPFSETGIIAHWKSKSTEIYPSTVFRCVCSSLTLTERTHGQSESIGNSLRSIGVFVSVSVCLGSVASSLHCFSISFSQWHFQRFQVRKQPLVVWTVATVIPGFIWPSYRFLRYGYCFMSTFRLSHYKPLVFRLMSCPETRIKLKSIDKQNIKETIRWDGKSEEIGESIDWESRKNHHLYNELNESSSDLRCHTIDVYDDFRCLLCAFVATVMHSMMKRKKIERIILCK